MTFPTTITRYIFWEVAKVFLVTLSVLVFVLVMVGIVQESVRKGLTLSVTFQLIPYVLPNALCFAIPGTILFSACSAYGQMSANNEITALKSAGISPIVALRPVLIFSLLLSLGSVWLIDVAFSWGYHGVQEVITSSVDEIAYSILSSQKHLSTDRFSCNVMRVEGRRLIQPTITIYGEPGTAKMTITAREATMDASPGKGDLRLTLTDGVAEVENQMSLHFKDSIEQVIHLTDAALGEHGTTNPSHMRLKRIPAATELQELRIEQLEEQLAIKAAYEMMTGDFTSSARSSWDGRIRELRSNEGRLHRLKTEPYRRWAGGFSCFCFALIGAPLSIRIRNADALTSFGICFLPILIVYYPLFVFGLGQAKSGAFPPYAVWMANVVCLGVGLWLMRKVIKH